MPILELKDYTKKQSLSEIYQKVGLRFTFVTSPKNGIVDQCHPWIKCRDFLQDAVRVRITGKDLMDIYGFKYEPKSNKDPKIDLEYMRMAVKDTDDWEKIKIEQYVKNTIKLLNQYEKIAKLKTLTSYTILDKVVIFKGPNFWLKSPSLISMFSLLLRLGIRNIKFKDEETLLEQLELISKRKNNIHNDKDNDIQYLKILWNKMNIVVKYAQEILFDSDDGFDSSYKKNTSVSNFHDYTGILSLCKYSISYPNKSSIKELKNYVKVEERKN